MEECFNLLAVAQHTLLSRPDCAEQIRCKHEHNLYRGHQEITHAIYVLVFANILIEEVFQPKNVTKDKYKSDCRMLTKHYHFLVIYFIKVVTFFNSWKESDCLYTLRGKTVSQGFFRQLMVISFLKGFNLEFSEIRKHLVVRLHLQEAL